MQVEDASAPQPDGPQITNAQKLSAETLQLEVQARPNGKDRLDINYQITNRTNQPVVLINVVSTDASKTPANLNPAQVTLLPNGPVRVGQFGLGISPTFPPLYSFTLVSPGKGFRNQLAATLPPDTQGKPLEFCLGVVPAAAEAGIKDLQLQETKPVVARTGTTLSKQQVFVCRPLQLPA